MCITDAYFLKNLYNLTMVAQTIIVRITKLISDFLFGHRYDAM
jgi:hypothetical protein